MYESNKSQLLLQLFAIWQTLYDFAMELTQADSDFAKIDKYFPKLLERWADSEIRLFRSEADLSNPKKKVSAAFDDLLEARRLVRRDLGNQKCTICGQPMKKGIFGKPGCLECTRRVTNALEELVMASTDQYTPREIIDRVMGDQSQQS